MNEETIKKLLESENIEDIGLGVSYLYKKLNGDQNKISEFLKSVGSYTRADVYIEDLNIVAWGRKHGGDWSVYDDGLHMAPLSNAKIIQL